MSAATGVARPVTYSATPERDFACWLESVTRLAEREPVHSWRHDSVRDRGAVLTDLLAERMCRTEGSTDQAALCFERIAGLVERSPNRTFADDGVRTSARRLARLLYLRLDGQVPDDE